MCVCVTYETTEIGKRSRKGKVRACEAKVGIKNYELRKKTKGSGAEPK